MLTGDLFKNKSYTTTLKVQIYSLPHVNFPPILILFFIQRVNFTYLERKTLQLDTYHGLNLLIASSIS